jgi:NAD(P)-dependent dehydrogenase (short-subunit alcohol dehydrogenase family)
MDQRESSIAATFRPDMFAGQGVLVTGAGRGIGAGIAQAFAVLGAHVVAVDIDPAGLDGQVKFAAKLAGQITAVTGDLIAPGACDRVFDAALSAAGGIHVLINNAGRSWAVATEDIGEARTQELIDLNLKAVMFLSRRFVLHARERGGGGSILQISSTAGVTGFQRRAVYTATKFGVIGLTKVLALDHAREGIRVNAIMPHVVETEMFRTVAKPHEIELWRAGIPMGRFASLEDIAALAVFLCSPAAAYLTGGAYAVDGGAMAGPYGEP